MSRELVNAIVNMDEKEAVKLARDLLAKNTPPLSILDACREAMEIIGNRFEKGEAFIPELIMAGEMLRQVTEVVKPALKESSGEVPKIGKVVIGTVQGDIHDIGKNIVVFMLDINGFEVIDLGVDVPPAKFVEAVKASGAPVVGLSGFLTLAYDPMKETVKALRDAGLNVKVMIGGGAIDEHVRVYTGADAFGNNAMDAVELAKQWIGA